MIAAVSPVLTTPVALVAGLGGIALALTGPLLATRGAALSQPARPATGSVMWWLTVYVLECVACALIFTAGKAFGVVPSLSTGMKITLIAAFAVCLTGALGLARRGFGKGL